MAYTKKVTMKDIAKELEISVATVSMVLNNKKGVSFPQETIDKIMDTAYRMGYIFEKKNYNKLEDNKKNIISIICPNISNDYYTAIIQSIEQEAYLQNYKTVVFTTFRDKKLEQEMVELAIEMGSKGIIFTYIPTITPFLQNIYNKVPMIAVGSNIPNLNIPIIELNYYEEGVLIGEHLINQGYRKIFFITTTLNTSSFAMRYQRIKGLQDIFKKKLKENEYKIVIKEKKVTPEEERKNIELEYQVGYNLTLECLEENIEKNITAFVGNNDNVSYGIIDAILNKRYLIPEDFGICGFDNDFPSKLQQISLTTVENFIVEKGRKAFEILSGIIYKKENKIEDNSRVTVEYQPKLIERNSTNKKIT